MRFSYLLYNALSLLCALLLCMVSYASDFPRDSVEPTVKEWNAVEEFSKRMGITHEEARVAMIMATTDLVEHIRGISTGNFTRKYLKIQKCRRLLRNTTPILIQSVCIQEKTGVPNIAAATGSLEYGDN